MVLGARRGSTPLSFNIQPRAQYIYDPITRRAVRVVETIVPTIQLATSVAGGHFPADRLYVNIGEVDGASNVPSWLGSAGGGTYQQWDSSSKRFYANGTEWFQGTNRYAWPLGWAGSADTNEPKNASVTKCIFEFRARLPQNSDFAGKGIGLSTASASGDFSSASHNIQVKRNVGNWELATSDGTTRSTSSAAGGDGNFHTFRAEWSTAQVQLFVDGTLVITKTTNLPGRPLAIFTRCAGGSLDTDVVYFLVRWD